MKLINNIRLLLALCTLSLGTQLLCQEAPEITYHTSIAPLAQHAAQVIASRLYKKSYQETIEALGGKNNCAYIYLNNANETLQNIYHEGECVERILTPKGCIAKDNPDALAYCFNQTFAGHNKKTTFSLKNLANYAVDENAPGCLQLLLSHVNSPGQLTTEKSFKKAIINGYNLCARFLLPYNNPEVVYQGYWSPLAEAFDGLEEAEKNVPIFTGTVREEYSKESRDYEHMISFLIDEIPNIIKQNESESVLSRATRCNAPVSLIKQIIALDRSHSLLNRKYCDRTPLYYAVDNALESENNTVVQLLLAKGSNPNVGEDHPLSLAIEELHPGLVQLLIQADAKPTKQMLTNVIEKIKESRSEKEKTSAQAVFDILALGKQQSIKTQQP